MQEIYDKLTPVRGRQKMSRIVRSAARCLLVAAPIAAVLATAGSLAAIPHVRLAGWIVLAGAPLVGIVIAFMSRDAWSTAAQAVDGHFHLDDRAQSAIAFLERGDTSGLYAIQVRDTAEHLSKLDTKSAVPFRFSKLGGASIACAIVAAAMLLVLPAHERQPIAAKHDVMPAAKLAAAPPVARAHLPDDVHWESAANDKVIRPLADAMPDGPSTPDDEVTERLNIDEQQIDRAYTPSFNTPQ